MIPQHCRQGREQGTVLIRQALLSGKILKGMQAIVVNCMGPHSIPSAAGMCYWSWTGVDVKFIISAFVVVVVVLRNIPCAKCDFSWWRTADVFVHFHTKSLNGGFHAITRKCEFKGCLHLWTCSSVPSRHKTCPLPNWLTFLDDCQETKTKRRLAARLQQRCWWEG